MTEEETKLDLSGAEITINGERHAVESGEMVVTANYDDDIRGQPRGPGYYEITADIEIEGWD